MKNIFIVPAFIFILVVQPVRVVAEPAIGRGIFPSACVRISTLIEKANDYDGQTIVLKGEAVGDLMQRAAGTWLNISDGSAAIGIFFKKGEIPPPRLNSLGDYFNHGDQLEVTGVFHKACRYHEGELDIHCLAVRVLEPGHKIARPVDQGKISLATVLFFWLLVVFLLAFLLKKKKPSA